MLLNTSRKVSMKDKNSCSRALHEKAWWCLFVACLPSPVGNVFNVAFLVCIFCAASLAGSVRLPPEKFLTSEQGTIVLGVVWQDAFYFVLLLGIDVLAPGLALFWSLNGVAIVKDGFIVNILEPFGNFLFLSFFAQCHKLAAINWCMCVFVVLM